MFVSCALVAWREGIGALTLTAWRATSSLATLLETRITLAPLAESCVAAERPMPSEAPVMRTVCFRIRSCVDLVLGLRSSYLAVHRHLVAAKETHCGGCCYSYDQCDSDPEEIRLCPVHRREVPVMLAMLRGAWCGSQLWVQGPAGCFKWQVGGGGGCLGRAKRSNNYTAESSPV